MTTACSYGNEAVELWQDHLQRLRRNPVVWACACRLIRSQRHGRR